jgi:hypothetical protein
MFTFYSVVCSSVCLVTHLGSKDVVNVPFLIPYAFDVARKKLTGESWFHISTPLEIEPGSLMTGSKRVDHWTSGTAYECSEIAGSSQCFDYQLVCASYQHV